jgi:hypothetical protein
VKPEPSYALTLDLLVRVLASHGRRSQVQATVFAEMLPALKGKASRGTLCQVQVEIERGRVIACSIRDQHGQVLLDGPEALAGVRQADQFVWTVQRPEPPENGVFPVLHGSPGARGTPAGLAKPVPWSGRSPPCLVRPLTSRVLHTLSRRQRVVLCLLDGKRTVADLCTMLHLSDEQVAAVLDELTALHLIQPPPEGHAPER